MSASGPATPAASATTDRGANPAVAPAPTPIGVGAERSVWAELAKRLNPAYARPKVCGGLVAREFTTTRGELLLIDARADAFEVLSRAQVITDDSEVHSHPALVGIRLYVRSATRLICVELAAPAS